MNIDMIHKNIINEMQCNKMTDFDLFMAVMDIYMYDNAIGYSSEEKKRVLLELKRRGLKFWTGNKKLDDAIINEMNVCSRLT